MDSDLEERLEMVKDFVTESRELLDSVEPRIIDMERTATDSGVVDEEILNEVFRLFHSLKGTAAFLDLQTIISVTHEAETLLDILRKNKAYIKTEHVDLLCRTSDLIRNILDTVERQLTDDGFEVEAGFIINDLRNAINPPAELDVAGPGILSPGADSSAQETGPEQEEEYKQIESMDAPVTATVKQLIESVEPDGLAEPLDLTGMVLTITPEMARRFAEETQELCEEAEMALLSLEKTANAELSSQVFRAFHSIKGNAGFFGYGDIENLSHLAENVLGIIRERKQVCDQATMPVLLSVLDAISNKVLGTTSGVNQAIPNFQQLIGSLEKITAELESEHEETASSQEQDLTGLNYSASNFLLQSQEYKPVAAAQDRAVKSATDKVLPDARIEDPGIVDSSILPKQPASSNVQQVIRVDIEKLDKLLDLVGELVIAEAMVTNDETVDISQDARFGKAFLQLDKISREIQEVAMSMRMIPLAGVFRRMLRLVRDLANKANKQVELEIIGEDTEVDKTIIEQISDPLVHLIRNAVDHGIESVAERRLAGKPETGKVTIEAKHSAGEVWITVEDDGGGLNREKIFRKGVEKGLIREEDRDMKDEDVWRLIFEPGFSTAEQVSNISGRGVGMDVVRRNIEKLRGKLNIRSKPGIGTMFAVRIPLTLAIIEGMVIRVGHNRYIIPISSIKESFRPKSDQITCTPDNLEIVRIRGELLPVARLHELYHIDPKYKDLTEGILIYVDSNDNKCCLFVDELIGQQQIVIKGLPAYLKRVRGISGCAIMGDGEVGMIMDIADLVSSIEKNAS
ncbi:MAG: chemotaxis protein CheA [Thermacetogeniaceae bacterium]